TIMAKKSIEDNSANSAKKVNPNTMQEAIRNLRSRFATGDVHSMKEIPAAYSSGMPYAIGLSYETMVERFADPRKLTLENILNVADVTNTDYNKVLEVALREAIRRHTKRDISKLMPDD